MNLNVYSTHSAGGTRHRSDLLFSAYAGNTLTLISSR